MNYQKFNNALETLSCEALYVLNKASFNKEYFKVLNAFKSKYTNTKYFFYYTRYFLIPFFNKVDDVVVLNIDTSEITVPKWLNLPPLPKKELKKLDKQLMEVAYPTYMNRGGGDTEMWKLTIWEHYDSAFQFAARPCEIDFKDVLHENNLLVLRDHFFRFFVSLLKSYEKHIKRPGAKNSSSSSKKPRGEYLSNAVSKCSCNYC